MDAIVVKKWTTSHKVKMQTLETTLDRKNKPHLHFMLQRMTAKAGESELYRDRLINWLDGNANYSQVLSLIAPFPSLNGLVVRNNVFLLNRIMIGLK